MKVKNNLKKSFNLGLIGLLSVQSIAANAAISPGMANPTDTGYFDDILGSSILNVSPGGFINGTDGAGNISGVAYHGTSVYFRFGPSFDLPEPVFNFSAPKMSVGCGGLSIKGMFASLIGLDRFEVMLKNAGASFAWGIVVGLVYSLPGIGTAFRMLNEWAKKIQQLFGNACQSGMNLGEAIGKSMQSSAVGSAVNKVGFGGLVEDGEKAMKSLENGFKSIAEDLNLKFDENMILQVPSSNTPTGAEVEENWKYIYTNSIIGNSMQLNYVNAIMAAMPSDSMESFLKQVFNAGSIAGITNFQSAYFSLTYDNDSETIQIDGKNIKLFKLSEITNFITAASIAQKSELSKGLLSLAFGRAMSGDLGISGTGSLSDYSKDIQKMVDDAKGTTTTTSTPEEKAAASKKLMDKMQGGLSAFKIDAIDPESDNITKKEEFLQKVISYILHGNTTGGGSSLDKDFKIKAPTFMVTALPADIVDQTGNKKIFVFNSMLRNNSPKFFSASSTSEGALKRSKNLIDAMVGNSVSAGAFNLQTLQDDNGIVLLVPGILDKIRIMQNSTPDDKTQLADLLAKYNAYQVTYTAVKSMLNGGDFSENELPAYLFNGDAFIREIKGVSRNEKVERTYQSHMNKMSNETKDLIKDLDKKIIDNFFSGDDTLKNSRNLDVLFREAELKYKRNVNSQNQPIAK